MDETILKSYLETFYKNGEDINKNYSSFFTKEFFKQLLQEFYLFSCSEMKKVTPDTIKQLGTKVVLHLGWHNKENFRPEEEVKISIQLKNVPTLYIHIFEINLENFYRKKKSPFTPHVNLDGLIAAHEL
jgi:hypothetical protein